MLFSEYPFRIISRRSREFPVQGFLRAPLYRGRTAAVIGYSPREETEAALEKLEKAAEGRFSPLNYCNRETVLKEIARLKGEN